MARILKYSRLLTININGWRLWASTEDSHLLQGTTLAVLALKLKSLIIHLKNGTKWRTIHSVLETGEYSYSWKFLLKSFFVFSISHYATTSTKESVYIIGGQHYETRGRSSIIAEYRNAKWYAGNLNQSRDGHGAITSGSLTMVIGGSSADGKSWVSTIKILNPR